jgi:hypothetical protein
MVSCSSARRASSGVRPHVAKRRLSRMENAPDQPRPPLTFVREPLFEPAPPHECTQSCHDAAKWGRTGLRLLPEEDAQACRGRAPAGEVGLARRRYSARAHVCPGCRTMGADLEWVHFRSPPWTWTAMCGREGWLTLCTACDNHVQFFMEVMN